MKITSMMMMTRKMIIRNRQLVTGRGMSLGLTWGLNLKLGDAPVKGSVRNYSDTSTLPLLFLL